MVTYGTNPARDELGGPHICPKCRSHRTQVIGQSGDRRTIAIRCSSCGERSTLPVTREESSTPHAPAPAAPA